MAAPPWLPYVLTAFLAVTIGIFLRRLIHILRLLRAGKAKERRWDHFSERVDSFIVNGLLQKKVYRSIPVGILHSLIFWAFLIIGASVAELSAHGYATGWQVPVLTAHFYW